MLVTASSQVLSVSSITNSGFLNAAGRHTAASLSPSNFGHAPARHPITQSLLSDVPRWSESRIANICSNPLLRSRHLDWRNR